MSVCKILFIVISVLLYPVIFWSKISHLEHISKFAIPLLVFILMVNTVLIYLKQDKKKLLLIAVAFFFVLAGDTLINLTVYKKLSPLPFAAAHVLFIIYFIKERAFKKTDIYLFIPVISVSALLFYYILQLTCSVEIIIVFIIYLLILSVMVWRGVCYSYSSNYNLKKRICIIIGSVLFYATDVLVGLGFLNSQSINVILTWLIYPPALFCLSVFNWYDGSKS